MLMTGTSHPTDSAILIRLAMPADAAAVLSLYEPFVLNSAITFELEPPGVNQMIQRITAAQKLHCWLVCQIGNDIAGYAYASEFRYRKAYRWITEVSVYVHEHFRRKGVARALYQAVHDLLKVQEYRSSMAVMTHPNKVSHAFHINYGFESVGVWERMGYKFNEWYGIEIFRLEMCESGSPVKEIKRVSEIPESQLRKIFNRAVSRIKK